MAAGFRYTFKPYVPPKERSKLIVAGTGHRPQDITQPLDSVVVVAKNKLRYAGADTFICGMTEGFDLLAAAGAMELGLKVWAARPWTNHKVGKNWEELYQEVLDYAEKVVIVTEAETYPGHWVMHKRNQWMVDNTDVVMAYLNPEKQSGGTFQCVKYAKQKKKPVANIYLDAPF